MAKLLGQSLGNLTVHVLDARVDVGLSRAVGLESYDFDRNSCNYTFVTTYVLAN